MINCVDSSTDRWEGPSVWGLLDEPPAYVDRALSGYRPAATHELGLSACSASESFTASVFMSDFPVLAGVAITDQVLQSLRDREILDAVLRRLVDQGTVTRDSQRAAMSFVGALPVDKQLPRVAPDGDGGVLMAWDDLNDGSTVITVSEGMIYPVARAGTANVEYLNDMHFYDVVPEAALSIIPGK
jgi:hypothetical protein